MMVYDRRLPHVRRRAFRIGPLYVAAAVAPFHGSVWARQRMTRSFATAAVMLALGTPRNECCCRGFVIPRCTPSDCLRRWPVTKVCLNFFRCHGVKGMTQVLSSLYAWVCPDQKLRGRLILFFKTFTRVFAPSSDANIIFRGVRNAKEEET